MIIEKEKLMTLIESYLPEVDDATLDRIATAVKIDAEAIIHSMIRQEVAQEKENMLHKKKTG